MNPEQIKQLQRKLADQGLYAGKIDGVMGPETKAARNVLLAREDRAAERERQRQQSEAEARSAEAEAKSAEARTRETELQAERESAERAPGRQATEFAKYAVPIAGGYYVGHRSAEGIDKRIGKMSPAMQRNMSVGRRFSPYAAYSLTRFLPEAGVAFAGAEKLRESNPVLSEVSQAAGTGLLSAGLVNMGEGLTRSLTAPDVPGGPPSVPPGGPPPNALAAAGPQSTPPGPGGPPSGPSSGPAGPQSTPPAAPPQQSPRLPPPSSPPQSPIPQNRDTLVEAARAAGAKGKLTKAEAAKYLKQNVTAENRAEVARTLRVKPGPNFASRIGKKISSLAATTKTLPGVAAPIVAGVVGYDMASSDAQARDMGPVEQTTRGLGGAVAGVAAYEGGRRLMNNPAVQRTLGRVLPPVAAYDMTRGAMEEGMHAWQGGSEDPVASGPLNNLLSQYDKAQVPTRNPLAQARENPDEFDRALSEFLDFAPQMQASP